MYTVCNQKSPTNFLHLRFNALKPPYFGKKIISRGGSRARAFVLLRRNFKTAQDVVKSGKVCYNNGEMRVTEISVSNWRNLARQKVSLGNQLNIFCGDNAQGKTNLVESVYLCCIGKSPRTDKDRELICRGKEMAFVRVKYNCRFGDGEIAVTLAGGSKKQIAVNSVPLAKIGDLMGYLNCIYFSPDEIRIISESPAERRRFLDVDLCQTDKNYFYGLSRFNKALAQRNNLLKQAKSLQEVKETVFVWDEQLAEEGAKIIVKRRAFCDKLKVIAKETHAALADESLELSYLTGIAGESFAEIADNYRKTLDENIEKDFNLRYTSAGCQRDDVALKLDGVDVRTFGSQGQMRTTALSLKLSELKIFKNMIGEYPVLILDDVLSELDLERQKRLLHFDDELQILLTSATEVPKTLAGNNCKYFTIKQGVCTERKN